MTPFEKLHPKVQRIISKMGWTNFRPIQDAAINHLLDSPSDLIISAPTASGKTEAAFLPILSTITDDFGGSFRVLYISPLKALINDQFRRVEQLCAELGIPVVRWHGDVDASQKSRAVKSPSGILLITPESLEALHINKPEMLRRMFANLKYIVIDETHNFVGQERGAQLRSLLTRIEKQISTKPLRIALSATIGGSESCGKWLSPGVSKGAHVITDDSDQDRNIQGLIRGYCAEPDRPSCLGGQLFSQTTRGKHLIFGNSKAILEKTCDALSRLSEGNGLPNRYYIHHGSLSKEIRESAEHRLKTDINCAVLCTSTLELGIDIGSIDTVSLLDPPWSVASFIQRIGRSGRKEGQFISFQFFLESEVINAESSLYERLRVRLVHAIALVELLLEGWCEPLETARPHLSTYVHQILSHLAQSGDDNAVNIYQLINNGSFCGLLNQDQFIELLRYLSGLGLISQSTDGSILLGPKGERLVDNYEFYSVFQTAQEWIVVFNGSELGRLPVLVPFKVTDHILLAGKRWQITAIDDRSRSILVVPAKGAKRPLFTGGFGFIHQRVHQKMAEIYASKTIPNYLDETAKGLLQEGRANFETFVSVPDSKVLPVFHGTRVQLTLMQILREAKVEADDLGVGFYSVAGAKAIIEVLRSGLDKFNSGERLAQLLPRSAKEAEKFDRFLPDGLLDLSYAKTVLDIESARKWLLGLG